MHLLGALIKWLFSLHELVWFLAGAISFSVITYFKFKLKESNKFSKGSFSLIVVSALTFAFALLWGTSSYAENEPAAANLGWIVFGGLAAVFGIIAYRLITKEKKVVVKETQK